LKLKNLELHATIQTKQPSHKSLAEAGQVSG